MLKQFAAIALGTIILVGVAESCSSLDRLNTKKEPLSTSVLKDKKVEISSSPALDPIEKSIHEQVNKYRQSIGLPPLKLDARISQQARIHSDKMAKGGVPFSHDGFQQRVKAIGQAITYKQAAENVAVNQGYADPATEAVRGWLKSSGHLENIKGPYDLTGIGVAKNGAGEYYFTQIFILRR